MSVGIGFASAIRNHFTIGIAQLIAELPLFSGLAYRIIIFIIFMTISIWGEIIARFIMKISEDPELLKKEIKEEHKKNRK